MLNLVKCFLSQESRKQRMIIPINPKSKIPMYEQIYQYLKEEIKSGRLLVHINGNPEISTEKGEKS